jgi:hypothetical protein
MASRYLPGEAQRTRQHALPPLPGAAQQRQSLTTYGAGAFCWYDLASLATDPKVILLYLKLKYAVGHIPL